MADLATLLERTSRTFALAIPLLPEPCREEVSLAYLVLRIADTLEDAASWPRDARVEALRAFTDLLRHPNRDRAAQLSRRWTEARPTEHAGHLELVQVTPEVLARVDALAPARREVVLRHTARTSEGMAAFCERASGDGTLELVDLADLRGYCYVVAGIVGELLTELFLAQAPSLADGAAALRERAATFGEALQLVNILKDARDDERERRRFLPAPVTYDDVVQLARADLDDAAAYVRTLETHHAPRGFVAFCALPVLLARATLRRLDAEGPGAKVSRAEVASIVAAMNLALDSGAPTLAT